MSEQEIQLEININIGNQRYQIKVPKNADLSQLVHHFLVNNHLNVKFQSAIIRMVEEKLMQESKSSGLEKTYSYNTSKESIEQHSRGIRIERNVEQKQSKSSYQTVKGNIKRDILSKIKEELEANKQQAPDSKKVYEQWKLKEKQKTLREKKPEKSSDRSKASNPKEPLSPDHFYKKGMQFRQTLQKNYENEFKKFYPFRLHDRQMQQAQQVTLFNRLYRQKKDMNVRSLLMQKGQEENARMPPKMDEVKRKLREADEQVDRMLYEMVRVGELSYQKNRPRSISPFRKTVIR